MKWLGVLILALVVAAGAAWKSGYLPAADPIVGKALSWAGLPSAPAAPKTSEARATGGDTQGAARQGGGSRRSGGPAVVTTVAAAAEAMPIVRKTIGTVTSPQSLTIISQTQGLVTEVEAQDGAEVAEGDVLVRIDDRIAAATVAKDQAGLDRDRASLQLAERALDRSRSLVGSLAVSKQAFDDATTAVETAQATVALDEAVLKADLVSLSQKTITAPFAGRLGAFSVVPGSLVQTTTAIVRLTRLDPLQATFTLSERDVAAVQSAIGATHPLAVRVSPLASGRTYDGIVDFVDASIDGTSGTFTARATLRNTGRELIPGQSLSIEVTLGTADVISVPSVAIQTSQQGTMVYVVGADGKVTDRPVTVALSQGDRVGLSSGIAAGDRVVIEGQGRLTSGMQVVEGAAATQARAGDNGAAAGKKQHKETAK